MTEHTLALVTRAIPFVMLALILAVTIRKMRRNPLARGGFFSANLSGLCVDDPVLEARLVAALAERRNLEPVALSVKMIAAAWICACGGLLVAGAAGTIARAQMPMLYAAMCLGLAAILMFAYFRMRNPQPIRVAVLQARSGAGVIPPFWFAASCGAAVLALVFAGQPAFQMAAILVCASSLLTTFIAWQLTALPARLAGKDIEIERFVDEGLRFRRTAKVLVLAVVQPYFFMCLALRDASALGTAAFVITIAMFLGFVVWMSRKLRRQPTLNGAAARP